MIKSISALAAVAALGFAAPAVAAVITPVSVTATSTFTTSYNVNNLINGTGLSGSTHDGYYGNMWMTEQGVTDRLAQVTFDLGGVYSLASADIWQFNYLDGRDIPGVISTLDRGVKDFRILTSIDGVNFTEALVATMARGTGEPATAQNFAFGGDARYVKLDILGNYADGTIYTTYASGLSEVRFNSAVPEPTTWAMMISGFGLVGGAMRRQARNTKVSYA